MKITYYNEDIPDWLKPHMKIFCECGAPMCDDGPVDAYGKMALTQRWCMNPQCPYHMAQKVVMLADYFEVEGVGEKTAQDMVLGYKFHTHLQALPYWFQEKPTVYLYEVAQLSYIYGVSKDWKDWLASYRSFEEYFEREPIIPWVALNNKEYLLECEKYFNIKKDVINANVVKVMITGSIHGFNSRSDFLEAVNQEFKDYFRVEDNKKTVRDTVCLIKEPESVDYSKTAIAQENNIPILNSKEFFGYLSSLREELKNEANGICR